MSDPGTDVEFTGQAMHPSVSGSAYVLAGHESQLVDPEPMPDRDPTGHVWHVDSLVAPAVTENFPDAQPMQAASEPARRVVLYRPALHTVQFGDAAAAHEP